MILNEISIFTITEKFKSGYWFTFSCCLSLFLQFGQYLAGHFRI